MTVRAFAIVYETATGEVRRLIDTSDDQDDSHLERVKKFLTSDETMEVFRQGDFSIRFPRFVAPFIGRGMKVDKASAAPIDASQIVDISTDAKAFADQQIAIERQVPKPGLPPNTPV